MSTFACPIVKINGFGKHKNADTLCITQIEGSTCIFKEGAFQKGDIALFIPIEAVVPLDHPAFDWLKDPKKPNKTTHRVKARYLRGVFSDGFLTPISALTTAGEGWAVAEDDYGVLIERRTSDGAIYTYRLGDDLSAVLGITKAVDQLPPNLNAEQEYGPDDRVPVYDIEPWKKYGRTVFDNPNEDVWITEKLHGTNARYVYADGRLWVGSRNRFIRDNDRNAYWNAAREFGLAEKLATRPDLVVFGEVYGVQDLKYDCKPGEFKFAVFDMYDLGSRRYLNAAELETQCKEWALPMVPTLYVGPIGDGSIVEQLTNPPEGDRPFSSTLGECVREGVVVKPLVERWNEWVHRSILKHVSQAYLTRKGGTEAQ